METATREKGTALDQQITSVASDTTTQEVITNSSTGQQASLELKLQIVGCCLFQLQFMTDMGKTTIQSRGNEIVK